MRSKVITSIILISSLIGIWQLSVAGTFYGKAMLAEQLIEQAWQKTLAGETQVKPWPWADTWPVAKLSMPRLGIEQIVLAGDSGRVLAFGPGFTEGSALPGTAGLSVISGHRDTSFHFLEDVQVGDRFSIQNKQTIQTFKIVALEIVDQKDYRIDLTKFDESESSVILVTCFPFDMLAGGDQRLLVLATSEETEI